MSGSEFFLGAEGVRVLRICYIVPGMREVEREVRVSPYASLRDVVREFSPPEFEMVMREGAYSITVRETGKSAENLRVGDVPEGATIDVSAHISGGELHDST